MSEGLWARTAKAYLTEALPAIGATGAQLWAWHKGRVVADLAIGTNGVGKMLPTTLHQTWCAAKVALALAVVKLAEDDRVDLGRPLSDLSARFPSLTARSATVADALCHDAGLGHPSAFQFGTWRSNERETAARNELGQLASSPMAQFSEVALWELLAYIISEAANADAYEYLREQVLAELGIENDIVFRPRREQWTRMRDRVGVWFATDERIPLLHDRTFGVAKLASFGVGAYTSTAALGRICAAAVTTMLGEPSAGLPSPAALRSILDYRRGREFDAVLGRPCNFAAGFAVDLRDHHFGEGPSDSAFATTGLTGSVFAIGDPDRQFAAAGLVNIVASSDEEIASWRPALTDCLYRDLSVAEVGAAR